MGHMSVVSGYVVARGEQYMEQNLRAIATYPFDDPYPFTNIFWGGSSARYFYPLIGLTGSYRLIEEAWSEWLWKFSQLLSQLEAIEARVSLDCIIGSYSWELHPRPNCPPFQQVKSFIGQPWVITEAPADDFSVDSEWLQQCERNRQVYDKASGVWRPYHWDRFVERLLETSA
jgi:hypothetical protein